MKDVINRIMILIIILHVSKVNIATSEIVIKPLDTEAVVNHTTFFNCSTSDPSKRIKWYHYSLGNSEKVIRIYDRGTLQSVYKSRALLDTFKNDKDNTVAFNLVIQSVETSDAGVYVCHEEVEGGLYGSAELIVLESIPVCRVLDQGDDFMGPNPCGMEREEVLLSCTTEYHGNISPTFQWKNEKIEISNDSYSQNPSTNSVTSVLRFRPEIDSVEIPSSFHCQTTKDAFEQYGCTIHPKAIKIIYAVPNFSISQMYVGDNATCSANSNQPCSYKWIWNHGGHDRVVSNNSEVAINSPGSYRCEAMCTVRKKPCPVISAQILAFNKANLQGRLGSPVHGVSRNISDNNPWKISVFVLLVVVLGLVVLASVLVVQLRSQKKQLSRMRESEGMLAPEIQVDLETRNLMPQVQHALDTETEIGRTTENTCSSTDLTCREGRNGLKTEDAKLGNVKHRKPSSELHDEEPR